MTLDYRSAIQEKLSAKKQELTETHESLKKYSTFNPLQPHYGNNVGQNRSNLFRNRLGPATNGANTMGGRLGPKVSATDSATTRTQQQTSAAAAKPASSSILSRVIVEQKSRDEAVKEQQKTTDKQEKARNRRMFGSIMGTLQTFVRDENRGKERDLKKREIEKKIEQRTEEEKEEAFKAKTQLFQDKRHKEREIKALQLQMRRVEEFEAWEACKRKHQGFIRTKTTASSKKGGGGSVAAPLFFLPKEHNRVTTKLAEETWEAIEAEITLGREAFEADLLRINARIDNPNIRDLENTDDEGEGGEGAEANESGEGLKSSVVVAKPEETQDETNNSEVTKNGETRRSEASPKKERNEEGDNRKRSRSPADPIPDEPRVKTEKLSPEKAVVKTEEKGGSKRPAPQSKERSVTPSASAKRSKKSPVSGRGGGSRKRTKKEEESKSSDESGSESSDSSSSSSSSSDSEEEKKKSSKKSKKSNSSGSRKR